jgi:hypothetical protein
MKALRIAIIAGAATMLVAPRVFAQATPAEFKCEASADKAGAKFVGSKSKCVQKCLAGAWKGTTPFTDCNPPYAGATAACVSDSLKGAEVKFQLAIQKACDPGTKATNDCPECYNGGDCSAGGYAGDQVQNIEGQVDSFVPGVACEQAGADPGEQKCENNTAKVLSKLVGSVIKCYDKCKSNELKGVAAPGSCNPPASDPATQTCISTADGKSITGIDKLCSVAGQIPDCTAPGADDYPSGANWVNLVEIAISGNIPQTYCEN